MDQHWHSVFDNSMRQTWVYFCYQFYAWLLNSLKLSPPYVSWHSYFSGDFKVNSHSLFADDFWSVVTQFSLSIPCVKHESIFAIGFMRRSWILLTLSTPYVSCHSYFSGDFKVYGDVVFADDFWSIGTQFSLTIPCVNDESVFSNDFTRQPWISIRCRFYTLAVTQFSKMISRSTVTQFSLMIYGSALA
jgi:hypothetical protein